MQFSIFKRSSLGSVYPARFHDTNEIYILTKGHTGPGDQGIHMTNLTLSIDLRVPLIWACELLINQPWMDLKKGLLPLFNGRNVLNRSKIHF